MRMITVIQGIVFEEKEEQIKMTKSNNELLSVETINTLFLKNLDFVDSQINLINKVENITREHSFFKKIGFVEILYAQKLSIIITKDKEKNIKSEFIVDNIELGFCKDSFKYFIRFAGKAKKDCQFLLNFVLSGIEDKESAMTEFEMIQERIVSEHINFPLQGVRDNGVTIRKISLGSLDSSRAQIDPVKKSSFKRQQEADTWGDRRSNSSNPRVKVSNDELSYSAGYKLTVEQQKDNGEQGVYIADNYNIFFKFNNLSLYLYDGRDFAFEDKYISLYETPRYNDNINSEYRLIDNYFDGKVGSEKEPYSVNRNRSTLRNYNSYIHLNLLDAEFKFFYFK
jgi:hypothetical protein